MASRVGKTAYKTLFWPGPNLPCKGSSLKAGRQAIRKFLAEPSRTKTTTRVQGDKLRKALGAYPHCRAIRVVAYKASVWNWVTGVLAPGIANHSCLGCRIPTIRRACKSPSVGGPLRKPIIKKRKVFFAICPHPFKVLRMRQAVPIKRLHRLETLPTRFKRMQMHQRKRPQTPRTLQFKRSRLRRW